PQGSRLQTQGQRSRAGVIGTEGIGCAGLAQDGVATHDHQHWRTLAPQLVLLQQAVEGAVPRSLVTAPVTDNVAPGLSAVTRGRPACGFDEREQVFLCNRALWIKGNTAVALGKQRQHRYGGVNGFWNHGAGSRKGS